MSNRIPYSQATQTGKTIAAAINSMLIAKAQMDRAAAILNAASFGNDWAGVANEVGGGISSVGGSSGNGQAYDLWYLVSQAAQALDAACAPLGPLDAGSSFAASYQPMAVASPPQG